MMKGLRCILLVVTLFAAVSCGKEERCAVPFGLANFKVEPNSAYYSGLNTVGGYMYFTGGHRGVIVVRIAYDQFVAFERTCPADSNTAVVAAEDWGGSLLECPECHTVYNTYADGYPLDGGATACPLYQYSTTYSGGELWVY